MRENILTYAKSEKRSLEEHPLGEVDSLILSWLGYLHYPSSVPAFSSWEGISLDEASTKWLHKGLFRGIYGEERTRLLYEAVAANPRFSALRILAFREEVDEERQMQFAAVSFLLPDGSCYVSFRGTDSSLVGWKEDFNMAYECPVPSQERAKRYLEEVASHCQGPLHVGGHSKGGNLAVYASVMAHKAVRDRIEDIHSHDGPGFPSLFYRLEEYLEMAPRIVKTVPQSSLFGLIMNADQPITIVKSDSVSFLQHYPFSWRIADGDFVRQDHLTADAIYFDQVCDYILSNLTRSERELFVDSVYDLIKSLGFSKANNAMLLMPYIGAKYVAMVKEAKEPDKSRFEKILDVLKKAILPGQREER